ncbi:MAG: hypothetical protein ACREFP_01280 [Acetobacteraceae bacterium]
MSEVSVDAVARTLRALLEHNGQPLRYRDLASGAELPLDVEIAALPSGFLPVFLVAGEAVWREATDKGFALEIVRDAKALLGYRLDRIGAGSFVTVMLSSMEAINQVARSEAIVVSEFNALWSAAVDRIHRAAVGEPRRDAGPRP